MRRRISRGIVLEVNGETIIVVEYEDTGKIDAFRNCLLIPDSPEPVCDLEQSISEYLEPEVKESDCDWKL